MSPKLPSKDILLNSIENTIDLELDRMAYGLRHRLRNLPHFYLRAVERAFLLAYQQGYDASRV